MQPQIKAKAKMQTQKGLNFLSNILPARSEVRDLIQQQLQDITSGNIQTLHKTQIDTQYKSKAFICTQFNRHKKIPTSYRSPYTNNYYPLVQDHNTYPTPILRDLQQKGNILFDEYARLYYGEDKCISNFYVYETEDGINIVVCIRKDYDQDEIKGVWCSSNICEIRGDPLKSVTYKLQTSLNYQLDLGLDTQNDFVTISGSIKKNKVQIKKLMQQYQIDEFHLMICGKIIEQTQTLLRQQLQTIFIAKSKEICFKNKYLKSRWDQEIKIKMGKQLAKMRLQTEKIVQ